MRMHLDVMFCGLFCCFLAQAGEALVTIDATTVIGPVNRLVLGGNLQAEPAGEDISANRGGGIWDPERRAPVQEVMAAVRRAGITSLRYPGGCWAHYWDWRLAVGPVEKRPQRRFGLPEFLAVCAELGVEPIITLPDFLPSADEAQVFAELARYLRAPVGRTSTGGADAAALRERDGRREPWPVVRFEYGNETFHGGHHDFAELFAGHLERRTPAEYVQRFHAVRAAMRGVDHAVLVGAVLDNDLSDPWAPWMRTVITGVAKDADFLITHLYYPNVNDADAAGLPIPAVFRAAFTAPRQLERRLNDLHSLIHATAGRDVPLAITEFNANFSLREPALRFSLGAAVMSTDLTLMLLEQPHIDCAHYWQTLDSYWGTVATSGPALRLRPAHLTQALLQRHLGSERLACTVACAAIESDGGWGVLPARGTAGDAGPLDVPRPLNGDWAIGTLADATARVVGDTLRIELHDAGKELDWYQASRIVGVERADRWRITAEVRTQGLRSSGVQLQVGDVRGWEATKSVALSAPVTAAQWTTISVDYLPLHDTNAISIIPRRRAAREAGVIEVRNMQMQPWRERSLGATPELSALATRHDAKLTSVVLINRRLDAPLPVRISGLRAGEVTAEVVTGPTVDATNEHGEVVRLVPLSTTSTNGDITLILPPHSVAGVHIALP
ncbi:MAG: hypothetical protein H0X38_05085 [Planctomycetes bacterium]|nr:hypothetical protein [Planctomycetota bacterium]